MTRNRQGHTPFNYCVENQPDQRNTTQQKYESPYVQRKARSPVGGPCSVYIVTAGEIREAGGFDPAQHVKSKSPTVKSPARDYNQTRQGRCTVRPILKYVHAARTAERNLGSEN